MTTRSPSIFGTFTREINKLIASQGIAHKGQFGAAGSFLSFRIEDPDGVVTAKELTKIATICEDVIRQKGVRHAGRVGCGYHMDGCVISWERL